jgi:hypothetical protein
MQIKIIPVDRLIYKNKKIIHHTQHPDTWIVMSLSRMTTWLFLAHHYYNLFAFSNYLHMEALLIPMKNGF